MSVFRVPQWIDSFIPRPLGRGYTMLGGLTTGAVSVPQLSPLVNKGCHESRANDDTRALNNRIDRRARYTGSSRRRSLRVRIIILCSSTVGTRLSSMLQRSMYFVSECPRYAVEDESILLSTYVFGVRLKSLVQFLGRDFVKVNVQLLLQVV